MINSLHNRSSTALLLRTHRKGNTLHLSQAASAPRRLRPHCRSVRNNAVNSSDPLSPQKQHVSAGRRELLHSTALLTLPTTSRNDTATTAPQQGPTTSNQPETSKQSPNQSDGPNKQRIAARRPSNPTLRVSAPGRIIAVGDIHGDIGKAISLFKMIGVVEATEKGLIWIGGNTTIVQLGDVLDRGSREIASLQLLRNLDCQARKQGGSVHMLNGNHESLNVAGDFRYATQGGMLETVAMAGYKGPHANEPQLQKHARKQLFSPGGPLARELARNATVLIVNDTLFVHGGVNMTHVQYGLDRINAEVASWMRGDRLSDGSRAPPPYTAMGSKQGVMWDRTLSTNFTSCYDRYQTCKQLKMVLQHTGCRRMVVGHTPQGKGLNQECGGQVWRVDVGMSSGVWNASPQALEIRAGREEFGEDVCMTVLGTSGRPPPQHIQGAMGRLVARVGTISTVSVRVR